MRTLVKNIKGKDIKKMPNKKGVIGSISIKCKRNKPIVYIRFKKDIDYLSIDENIPAKLNGRELRLNAVDLADLYEADILFKGEKKAFNPKPENFVIAKNNEVKSFYLSEGGYIAAVTLTPAFVERWWRNGNPIIERCTIEGDKICGSMKLAIVFPAYASAYGVQDEEYKILFKNKEDTWAAKFTKGSIARDHMSMMDKMEVVAEMDKRVDTIQNIISKNASIILSETGIKDHKVIGKDSLLCSWIVFNYEDAELMNKAVIAYEGTSEKYEDGGRLVLSLPYYAHSVDDLKSFGNKVCEVVKAKTGISLHTRFTPLFESFE